MNPYDRGSAFGKCLTLTCERPNLVRFWTLHSDTGSLFPLLCCKEIIVLHFSFFPSAIGPDGMCCQSREFKEWHGCRSTKAVTKGKRPPFLCFVSFQNQTIPGKIYSAYFSLGKFYYEVACHDQGLCRVGWSTAQASLDLGMFLYDLIILICLCHYFSNNNVWYSIFRNGQIWIWLWGNWKEISQ